MRRKKIGSIDNNYLLRKKISPEEFLIPLGAEDLPLQIAHLIRGIRMRRNFTQSELATKLGVPQTAIARLETASARRTPSLLTLHKALKKMGYSLSLHVKKIPS